MSNLLLLSFQSSNPSVVTVKTAKKKKIYPPPHPPPPQKKDSNISLGFLYGKKIEQNRYKYS